MKVIIIAHVIEEKSYCPSAVDLNLRWAAFFAPTLISLEFLTASLVMKLVCNAFRSAAGPT
jgi:hypothetical protein